MSGDLRADPQALIAKWREEVESRHNSKHSAESCPACQQHLADADELETLLAAEQSSSAHEAQVRDKVLEEAALLVDKFTNPFTIAEKLSWLESPMTFSRVMKIIADEIRARQLVGGEIGYATHEQLWKICTKLVTDFEPYGKRKRDIGDCSGGCKFYHVLEGPRGADWGVCWNPKSPRAGLLTFEHMGCPQFSYDKRCDKV